MSRRGKIYDNARWCLSKVWFWCGQGEDLGCSPQVLTADPVLLPAPGRAAWWGRQVPYLGAGLSQAQPGQEPRAAFQLLPSPGKQRAQVVIKKIARNGSYNILFGFLTCESRSCIST